jgi:hypothetical protein
VKIKKLRPASATAEGKLTKADVHFEHPASMSDHCGQCVHFKRPHSCEIVAGRIARRIGATALSSGGLLGYMAGRSCGSKKRPLLSFHALDSKQKARSFTLPPAILKLGIRDAPLIHRRVIRETFFLDGEACRF